MDAISQVPVNKNPLNVNGFRFSILRLPHVKYFVQRAAVPGITAGRAVMSTPFNRMPLSYDKIQYEDLQLTFLVDEELDNYVELLNWIKGLGFPDNFDQYKTLAAQEKTTGGGLYSDATLTILTSSKIPNVEIRFEDLFPVALSEISFEATQDGIQYAVCTCTFAYARFNVVSLTPD